MCTGKKERVKGETIMNIAIITGASSGMGMEFARQLDNSLHKTDEIWLLARRREPMEELARTLRHNLLCITLV